MELILKYGAKNLILVHNHPSGDPSPSNEDKLITDDLTNMLKGISVNILDHLIIGSGKIYSLLTKSYIDRPKLFL